MLRRLVGGRRVIVTLCVPRELRAVPVEDDEKDLGRYIDCRDFTATGDDAG